MSLPCSKPSKGFPPWSKIQSPPQAPRNLPPPSQPLTYCWLILRSPPWALGGLLAFRIARPLASDLFIYCPCVWITLLACQPMIPFLNALLLQLFYIPSVFYFSSISSQYLAPSETVPSPFLSLLPLLGSKFPRAMPLGAFVAC